VNVGQAFITAGHCLIIRKAKQQTLAQIAMHRQVSLALMQQALVQLAMYVLYIRTSAHCLQLKEHYNHAWFGMYIIVSKQATVQTCMLAVSRTIAKVYIACRMH